MKFTKYQKEVLIGILLGDANLQTFNNGKTFRLRIDQKDKKYAEHLANVFEPLTKTKIKLYVDKAGNFHYRFNTLTSPIFRFYAHQFYSYNQFTKKWEKKVPKLIHRWLSPTALAYWYMDDGSSKWNKNLWGVRYSTNCFTLQDVKLLCETLKENFNILAKPQKHRENQYLLYIEESEAPKLKNYILDFIYP